MSTQVIKVDKGSVTQDSYEVAADKMISGSPSQAVWNAYTDPTEAFSAGIWQGDVAKWRVSYTEDEFCFLINGRVELINQDGTAQQFSAGDGFVIPAGFEGTWENLEPTAKYYAIMEHGEGN